ncbi:MAG: tetratricopeptide repeat protein [Planctomycetota bacterium]
MHGPSGRDLSFVVGVLLALLTILAYSRVIGNGFIGLDDDEYVTENLRVQAGLTWDGLAWAFTTAHAANWHPLTWLSHMLDVELFGLRAWGHHLTNLAFHAASAVLLFHLLVRTTSTLWPSAFVAAVFALHPLHVESVAWVAERKDVLSAFFWILTTLAYVRWVERPGARRYSAVLGLYALGLLAKPMLVTLPFTLLLLDLWPLRRAESSWKARVLEKWPLFALAAASSVVTYAVQRSGGAMMQEEAIPFALRVQNAFVACAGYLGKSVAPFGLSVFYPHPGAAIPVVEVLLAALGLALATALVLREVRGSPWLAVGWLWFLGTLVPVLGLVQVGSQAMADRYTYVPMIGLALAVAFGGGEIVRRFPSARVPAAAVSCVLVLGWSALTWRQVGFWRSSQTLFARALEIDPGNYLARGALGVDCLRAGRLTEAESELRESVRIQPNFALGHCNLGAALERQGRVAEAVAEYETALRHSPRLAHAHQNLGRLLGVQGRTDLAIEHLEAALRSAPDSVYAHFNLGVALLNARRVDEGIEHLERALELDPRHENARETLARALSLFSSDPR